ncbi:hypothetical protein HR51_28800 [Burkholderia cepacia]|nr:hypothetical protein HR51_28800 [Burkholderia cepacia]
MLHLLQCFKVAMDWHCSKLLIMDKKQRFECSSLGVRQGPRVTALCTRNAPGECGIGAAIQFCFAVWTQVEREHEHEHIGERGDRLNVTVSVT